MELGRQAGRDGPGIIYAHCGAGQTWGWGAWLLHRECGVARGGKGAGCTARVGEDFSARTLDQISFEKVPGPRGG